VAVNYHIRAALTRAAVTLLTRRFARDLGRHRITVKPSPAGFVLTEMVTAGRSEEEIRARTETLGERRWSGGSDGRRMSREPWPFW
jgi:NAD(P)-dependent dehydrogenase (short-subunit alcohol dehydrogenase family)